MATFSSTLSPTDENDASSPNINKASTPVEFAVSSQGDSCSPSSPMSGATAEAKPETLSDEDDEDEVGEPAVSAISPTSAGAGATTSDVEEVEEEEAKEMEESPSVRLAREIEESEALARQLMAEEAQQSFAMQYEMFQSSSADMPMADLVAVQQLLRADEEAGNAMMQQGGEAGDDDATEEYAEEDGEYDDDDDETGEDAAPGYEDLIELGRAIGDVKAERWAFKAQGVIDSLPCVVHKAAASTAAASSSSSCCAEAAGGEVTYDTMCIFCQDHYAEGDRVRILPCKHAFHAECVDEWLKTKDCCPICKQCVVEEEDKGEEKKQQQRSALNGEASSSSSSVAAPSSATAAAAVAVNAPLPSGDSHRTPPRDATATTLNFAGAVFGDSA